MPDTAAAGAVANLPRRVRLPLALSFGVLMGLGAAPYDLWYLAFAGLVGAFCLFAATCTKTGAAGTGWMVGLGYFGFSMGWIVEPFLVDAALTGWMAPFGLFGLAGGLALFWGLAFWGAARVRGHAVPALVLAWCAAELARAYVLTGFPWALVGYLWLPVPPIQWVALVGPHGLTFLTLTAAALLCAAIIRPGPRLLPTVLGAAVLVALFAVGQGMTPPLQAPDGRPVVRLIQPNAPQHEKWDPAKIPVFFNRQVRFTAAAPTDAGEAPALIVWPETALPMLLHRAGDAISQISEAAGSAQVAVGVQRTQDGRYYNSLAVIGPDGDLRTIYDKHHLVPFGEYMPAKWFFSRFEIGGLAARTQGGYASGPGPELIDLGPLGRALPLICYEAVFPQDIYGAPGRADFLMQVTNDAWFGAHSGPYQHLAQARIRAIEQGLPMVRSANTGVSAVIDGAGRVLTSLPLGEAGFVDAPLPEPLRVTPYSRMGDLPMLAVLLVFSAVLIVTKRRGTRAETD